jgi:hypothetical protein
MRMRHIAICGLLRSTIFSRVIKVEHECVFVQYDLTFRNPASYIKDGHTATFNTPHFLYFFNKYTYWIFKRCCTLSNSFSSKCRLFHNANFFGSWIIHILHTGVLKKFKKFGCQKVNLRQRYGPLLGPPPHPVPPHVHIHFVVPPPGCGQSVTDFWGWGAHRAQLRCTDDKSDDKYEFGVTGGALNLNSASYLDYSRCGHLPLQGKMLTVEPRIKPGNSWLIIGSSDHQTTRLVFYVNVLMRLRLGRTLWSSIFLFSFLTFFIFPKLSPTPSTKDTLYIDIRYIDARYIDTSI